MVSNSEKKEKSLAEFIVIVALIGVLMAIFINYFNKSEEKFTNAGFATMAQSFNTKVNTVHAQWMMDKQPHIVYLASLNKETKQAVSVNRAGWIDVNNTELPCEAIWKLVMETPMNLMNVSVSAIEVHTSNGQSQGKSKVATSSRCHYVLLDGSYFQYDRARGKVSKVLSPN